MNNNSFNIEKDNEIHNSNSKNKPINEINKKIDYSIHLMRGILNTPLPNNDLNKPIDKNEKEQMGKLIDNVNLISNNMIRIFSVLRETNFVKIQELIEIIHQMFVRQQLGD